MRTGDRLQNVRIYKYPLAVEDVQQVEMPRGAKVLCVQTQGDAVCLWALVATDAEMTKRTFAVYGTGHPTFDAEQDYIGTFQLNGGARGIVLLKPPQHPMSNAEALVLAAWLVAMTRDDASAFGSILEKVMST